MKRWGRVANFMGKLAVGAHTATGRVQAIADAYHSHCIAEVDFDHCIPDADSELCIAETISDVTTVELPLQNQTLVAPSRQLA